MSPTEATAGAAKGNISKSIEDKINSTHSASVVSDMIIALDGTEFEENKMLNGPHSMARKSKKKLEKHSNPDLLYNIVCQNHKGMESRPFVVQENPFDDGSEFEDPPSSSIIQIYVSVKGRGTLPTIPGFRLKGPIHRPRMGPRMYDDYNDDMIYLSDTSNDSDGMGNLKVAGDVESERPKGEDPPNLREILDNSSFKPSSVTVTGIKILSKRLVNLLRSFVREYPSQTLKGDSILVSAPFRMLAHYYKDLVYLRDGRFHEIDASEKDKEALEPLDEETKYDLSVLLKYFERHYAKDVQPDEIKLKDAGVVCFSMLWFLFKPGMQVYARMGKSLAGFIFEKWDEGQEVSGPGRPPRMRRDESYDESYPRTWGAVLWNLSYSGRRIIRVPRTFWIKSFIGEKDVLSLPLFPAIYLDASDGGRTKAKLLELGQKSYQIIRESPTHLQYSGPAWNLGYTETDESLNDWQRKKPDTEYTGEIMIDHRGTNPNTRGGLGSRRPGVPARRMYDDPLELAGDDSESEIEGITIEKELLVLDTRASSRNFKPINPQYQAHLTPQHYFLLPRAMVGFALTQKQRMGFDIENTKPMDWPSKEDDPMNTLILGDSDKDVIKALAKKYSRTRDRWAADFIRGKGEGQILLLHGPPGTGKTYTVECVAKLTRRPLLRLTVADIGTNEKVMEYNLGEWFQRGSDWGAIILLDEADVFLEKRQIRDLQRNSLVSVFLSSLEYYTGMLFLTTNRIGQIDDAFLSRTSVAITYETLDIGKQRRIWEGFLKKLSQERKDIVLTDRAKKFLENLDKSDTTKHIPWNGREIRNALQTAIALAAHDADREAEDSDSGAVAAKIFVRDEHFQAVVDRRKEFIDYRKSIRNMDEEARAYTEGNRALAPKPAK